MLEQIDCAFIGTQREGREKEDLGIDGLGPLDASSIFTDKEWEEIDAAIDHILAAL